VIVFDIAESHVNILKTKGFSVIPRKNHCASMYLKSMVVYGGQAENGSYLNEMLVLHLDFNEWVKLSVKNGMNPFIQGACCTVISGKKASEGSKTQERKVSKLICITYVFNSPMPCKKEFTTSVERTQKENLKTV
jgi:hypothetical protein